MHRRLAPRERLATLCALTLVMLAGGCCCCGEKGFMLSGNWSFGLRRSPSAGCGCSQAAKCDCGQTHSANCVGSGAETNQPEVVEESQGRRTHPPLLHLGEHAPPPAVHSRFHPVPTRPVFGGVEPAKPRQTIEALPHEFDSTPRVRSVPRPRLDPEDLKEQKQRAKDAEREEEAPLPRDFSP